MSYKILDVFSIRTPSLPFKHYFEIDNICQENLNNYLKNEEMLDFTKRLLFFSSMEMYNNYKSSAFNNDKYYSTLKKYLIRAVTRPTPFGLCSGVALGKFAKETDLIIDNKRSKENVFVDNSWLINIIKQIEQNKETLKKLYFKFNPNTYVLGDRLKSIKMINKVGEENLNDITSYDIKNSSLITFIKKIACNFISFENICNEIKKIYPQVEDELIENLIFQLIENEFLISNLFPNVYDMDLLNHLILELEKINEKEICDVLKKISNSLDKYKCFQDTDDLKNSIKLMEGIFKQKNYFYINKADTFTSYFLEEKIKSDLEKFINSFKKLYVDKDDKLNLTKFKKNFSECYGYNVLVKLTDIIDNELLYSDEQVDLSQRENNIKQIIDRKILECILTNKEEVCLYESDFYEIIKNQEDYQYSNSIDINFSIIKKDKEYEYYIAPNIGSDKAGCMFNRFSRENDKVLYKEYLDEIKKNDGLFENDIETILIDIKDLLSFSRGVNIACNEKINNYCLPFYFSVDKDEEVTLNDLFLTIDYNNNLEIVDIKHNKKCKIITNDMINTVANNKVVALLRNITEIQVRNPIYRLHNLTRNSYIYTPRIRYEKVIIQPEKWEFHDTMFNLENFVSFKEKFIELSSTYNLKRFVYLTVSDNRLLIDTHSQESLKTIFKYIKKHKELVFTEFEYKNIDSCIVKNKFDEKFISETTFSFVLEDEHIENKDNEVSFTNKDYKNYILEKDDREKLPFEDNWIYYKIYNVQQNKDKLITYLEKLSTDLRSINKFFFIRYYDSLGYHFRLRIKFEDANDFSYNIEIINKYLQEMRLNGVCRNIAIDTYQREINRYGGKNLIEDIEDFFSIDTKIVFHLYRTLNLNNNNDLEKAYFIGIISLMKVFYDTDLDILKSLNDNIQYKEYRKEYASDKERYMKLSECLLDDKFYLIEGCDESFLKNIDERSHCLNKIKHKINTLNITNSKDNIIYSLNHMYCNRLNGSNILEDKMLSIVRHSIRDLINRNKFYIVKSK